MMEHVTDIFITTNGHGEILNMIERKSKSIFEENSNSQPVEITGAPKSFRGYVSWGDDNNRPLQIIELIRNEGVMSSNKFFDMLLGYSGGLRCTDEGDGTEVADDSPAGEFYFENTLPAFWAEQQADMKHFFFSIAVIILSGNGKKIVEIHHKEATYCRFETCNPDTGKIEHIFYGDWSKNPSFEDLEAIPLLDIKRPYVDLMIRMGNRPDPKNGKNREMTKERKFAIATVFPTVGAKYYPFPPYQSVFLSGWYDIQIMIPVGKKAKFKNGLAVRWVVSIHPNYWQEIFNLEKITDPKKQSERVKIEKENFKNFLTGIENSDKTFVTGFYTDTRGITTELVKFTRLDFGKEGGDWLEDSEEASNMICYADSIHPSMIGATPGKTKGSFSGSDKRELFTMKQILEKAFHDILLNQFKLISRYNGWSVKWDVPLLMLTTLDKGADAQPSTHDAQVNTNNTES